MHSFYFTFQHSGNSLHDIRSKLAPNSGQKNYNELFRNCGNHVMGFLIIHCYNSHLCCYFNGLIYHKGRDSRADSRNSQVNGMD